jgi:hypothetical protein
VATGDTHGYLSQFENILKISLKLMNGFVKIKTWTSPFKMLRVARHKRSDNKYDIKISCIS